MKKPVSRKILIRGESWRVVLGRPPQNKCAALCDPDTKTIWIRPSATGSPAMLASHICHEVLHAAVYDLDERAVEEIEDALMAGLGLIGLFD